MSGCSRSALLLFIALTLTATLHITQAATPLRGDRSANVIPVPTAVPAPAPAQSSSVSSTVSATTTNLVPQPTTLAETNSETQTAATVAVSAATNDAITAATATTTTSTSTSQSDSDVDSDSEDDAELDSESDIDSDLDSDAESEFAHDDAFVVAWEELRDAHKHTGEIKLLELNANQPAPTSTAEQQQQQQQYVQPQFVETTSQTREDEEGGGGGGGAAGGGGGANPTYVLPYPPLSPHHPLHNFLTPFSNVNPLSFPYAGGGHPAFSHPHFSSAFGNPGAAAAAAYGAYSSHPLAPYTGWHPGSYPGSYTGWAYNNYNAVHPAHAAYAAGTSAYPYYPYYGGVMGGNGLPLTMKTEGVGTNTASDFPQFLETASYQSDCVGCVADGAHMADAVSTSPAAGELSNNGPVLIEQQSTIDSCENCQFD